MDWKNFSLYKNFYTVSSLTSSHIDYDSSHYNYSGDCSDFAYAIRKAKFPLVQQPHTSTKVYNIPCSFDIETSSWYEDDAETQKRATMYIWQLSIGGYQILGRTWEEFLDCLETIKTTLHLCKSRLLVIYVHNLQYEFQFIRKLFEWDNVFMVDSRRPVRAVTGSFIFKCSLLLSNYSLANVGKLLLTKYKVMKAEGDLDYSLVRHSQTPITASELGYCISDIQVVTSFIQEKIEQDGNILKIPLTNTGYVRNYCREECFTQGFTSKSDIKRSVSNYRALMKCLQIKSNEEYEQNKRVLMGGFTHANAYYSGKVVYDVGSADIASSYPKTMVCDYFPMSASVYIGSVNDAETFLRLLETYCCIFDITFYDLEPSVPFENPLSLSRCDCENPTVNNGRVVSATVCHTTLTELDYDTISRFYTWSSFKVYNMRTYIRNYLPRPLIMAVLKLYADKTLLKGDADHLIEYMVSKNMVNSSYGMMVTDIVREIQTYDGDNFTTEQPDIASQLADYNDNYNRFQYYTWGVYVTAHARHSLFEAIYEFKNDYVYCDTDSIKGVNFDSHQAFFDSYNLRVQSSLLKMCDCLSIPFELCTPKTKEGVTKMIGIWEREHDYSRFKTLGAKRYLVEYSDTQKMELTVSGLNKHIALSYILSECNNDHALAFDFFRDYMFIPAGHTGKNTVTYIDSETSGYVEDYLGEISSYHELSSTHMEAQSYLLSQSADYIKYLQGASTVTL